MTSGGEAGEPAAESPSGRRPHPAGSSGRGTGARAPVSVRPRPDAARSGDSPHPPAPTPLPLAVRLVAPDALERLARTRATADDLALLQHALHSRRLVLLKSLLTRLERDPRAVPAPARERFEAHWSLMERAEARHAPAVRDTLDYPSVGNWLARALAAPQGASLAAELEHFGSVAAAAALRSGAAFTAELAAPGGILALPGIGLLEAGAPVVRLTARARTARLTVPGAGRQYRPGRPGPVLLRGTRRVTGAGTGWHGLRRLPGGAAVLDDLDPYRAPAAGVGRSALPPSGRTAGAGRPWTRRWRAALGLLRATDPQRAAETTALLRCLVPVARPADGGGTEVSATVRAAPGAILATLPRTAADLAEVLVHETQHTKLAVLHDLVPLHDAGPAAVHRVAWRPDPRPLAGVFQGTYAHLALAEFWDRAAQGTAVPDAVREQARARRDSYRRQVAEAVPILLESSELTPAGREFATGMERLLLSLGRTGRMASGIAGASSCDDVQ
ncbi:aKG-HExxH-type peptide beta-hydroxylase [Streptomyces sp. NPDC021100]|uniref:aKG-HExxH-type peptide beta-hydroxylase n=1 Tax=Streptomyces sp. NPDC021100 TaxID=3365114 RepID=UPI0037B2E6C5